MNKSNSTGDGDETSSNGSSASKRSKLDINNSNEETSDVSMSSKQNEVGIEEKMPEQTGNVGSPGLSGHVPGKMNDSGFADTSKIGEKSVANTSKTEVRNNASGTDEVPTSSASSGSSAFNNPTGKQNDDANNITHNEQQTGRSAVKRRRHPHRNYRSQLESSSSSSEDDSSFDRIVFIREGDPEPSSIAEIVAADAEEEASIGTDSTSEVSNSSLFWRETSENDDDDEDGSQSTGMACESDSEEYVELMGKDKPPYVWSQVLEVMQRENGLSGNRQFGAPQSRSNNQIAFQDRVYASRHTIEKLELMQTLDKHNGCVNSLNFNRSGDLLASGSDDLKIIIWKWAQQKKLHRFDSGHISNVFQTKFIDLGAGIDIVSSSRDGQVRHTTIPASGGKPISNVLIKHSNSVHKVAVCPQNRYEVLTAGEDGIVVRCDLRDNCSERLLTVKQDKTRVSLYSVSHHPLDPEFCVCGRDQFVRVYDKRALKKPVSTMCPQNLLDRKNGHITCAVYNATGSEILASYSGEHIYLFNNMCYLSGHYTHRYQGHYNHKTIKGVNFFGPNSEYVISGSDCGNIFFWDKEHESVLNWLEGDYSGVVNCLEPHPSFPILATSGLDYDVKLWEPSNSEFPPKMTGLAKCVKHNIKRSEMAISERNTFYDFVRESLQARFLGSRLQRHDDFFRSMTDGNSSLSTIEDDNNDHDADESGHDENFDRFQSLPCAPQ